MKPPGRRTPTAALAVISLLCGWLALRPDAGGAIADPAPRPLWSPDRLPAVLAEAQGTVDLERAVDELLGASDVRSCVAVYEGDRPVLLRHVDEAFVPASTQKILVGLAALTVVGPDFRYETRVRSDARPRDGVVGNLWLEGAGDPTLATPEYIQWLQDPDRPRFHLRRSTPLTALVDGLRAAGVTVVTGGIAGDDSRYDRTRIVPSWKETYVIDNEVGPLGALLADGGFTDFEPPEERADDPAVHAAAELTRLAQAAGIPVAGPPTVGTAPPEAEVLATVRSAPLSDIVAGMLRESDNTAAELLVREIGVVKRQDGSTAAGTRAVTDALAEAGLPTAGLQLRDGSGLDVGNRSTCALLAATLRVGGADGAPLLGSMLAVTGRSGTLARRLAGTPLEGKLRGKTGSLNRVTGLAGYLEGHRNLSFALLANGSLSNSAGRVLQDRLAALLASYPGPQPRL